MLRWWQKYALLQDGTTATHLAAWKGHLPVLSYLLNSGADVNVGNIGGQTALHEAAEAGQEAACQELLKHKADPLLRDSDSRTAADLARANELPRLAELLKPPPAIKVEVQCLFHISS